MDRWRVQNEEFDKEKYVEIAKNEQQDRVPQVGHYKIQTQNVKKTNIYHQQWRAQIKVSKTWRRI